MAVTRLSDIFDIGLDILKTVLGTNNTILAQLGDVVAEASRSDNAEWWQHVGFASRPSNATKQNAAAQAISIKRSDRDVVIASRDVRGQQIYGSLNDGETCVYATGPDGVSQGRVLLKSDGSVNAYTKTGDGKSVILAVTPTGVNIGTPWGAFVMDSSGVRIGAVGGAAINLDSSGNITLIGNKIAVNGASVSVGAAAVAPAIYGPTGIAGVASTSVTIAI